MDVLTLARQKLTSEWWLHHRESFDVVISPPVMEEIRNGDQGQTAKRTELVGAYPY